MHVTELLRMGADASIAATRPWSRGRQPAQGAPVMATDLRASASLVVAALAAHGETAISRSTTWTGGTRPSRPS